MALEAWALDLDLPVIIYVILRKITQSLLSSASAVRKEGWTKQSLNHLDCMKQTLII